MNYVFCPNCEPVFRKSKPDQRVGVQMECIESNYSGTGTDRFECRVCEKQFFVTYKVDKITPIEE